MTKGITVLLSDTPNMYLGATLTNPSSPLTCVCVTYSPPCPSPQKNDKMGASTVAMDLLGSLSLVETLVEFVYVVRSLEKFTRFERLFFSSAGVSEIAGEALLVLIMVNWLHKKRTYIGCLESLASCAARAVRRVTRCRGQTKANDGGDEERGIDWSDMVVTTAGDSKYAEERRQGTISAVEERKVDAEVKGDDVELPNMRQEQNLTESDNDELTPVKAREHLELLSRDPIHALKGLTTTFFDSLGPNGFNQNKMEKNKQHMETVKTMLVVVISLVVRFLPTLVLGVVLIVARSGRGNFRSAGDERLMLALTVVSLISLAAFVAFLVFAYVKIVEVGRWKVNRVCAVSMCQKYSGAKVKVQHGRGKRKHGRGFVHALYVGIMKFGGKGFLFCMLGGSAVIYSVEKVFEVVLLLSRNDRLASEPLSQALIVFQLLELTSIASILYVLAIDFFFGDIHKAYKPNQLEMIEDSLRQLLDAVDATQQQLDRFEGQGERNDVIAKNHEGITARLANLEEVTKETAETGAHYLEEVKGSEAYCQPK